MTELEATIRRHLPAALFDRKADSKDYHEQFRASGQAKAASALHTLRELQVDLHKSVYISVGGSYGSEIVWLLDHSELRRGVLLEYDPSVVSDVMHEVERLAAKGKSLVFIPGDATQQADSCRRQVERWSNEEAVETVVCSAHAVFHELPTRSPNFHLGNFLHKMLYGWPRSVFISREPCAPVGWPDRVELSVGQLPADVLQELAREIQRHLPFSGEIRRVGDFVELSDLLAVETLVKLFYAEDLLHELEERLTTIVPTEFANELEKLLGPSSVSLRYVSTKSFDSHYRRLNVRARRLNGQPLPIPAAFCEFVGDSRRPTTAADAGGAPVIETARIEIRREPPAPEAAPAPEGPRRTRGYLRRRCRVITSGGSRPFQHIMHSLFSQLHDRDEAMKEYEDAWEELSNGYERVMTQAAYLESMGAIELMNEVLANARFEGVFESARKLYEAIAREKLDDLAGAKRLIMAILASEKQKDILRAAQFNLHVCYQKAGDHAEVNFVAFLKDAGIRFVDGERLSDKAVAMELIASMQQERPFMYKKQLNESLEYLLEHSCAGYAKTLLTKIESEKSQLTPAMIDTILQQLRVMDTNSRTAVMVRLADNLPRDQEALRQQILERVRLEPQKSITVHKWKLASERTAASDESVS